MLPAHKRIKLDHTSLFDQLKASVVDPSNKLKKSFFNSIAQKYTKEFIKNIHTDIGIKQLSTLINSDYVKCSSISSILNGSGSKASES
ncbi:hypothetical protein, partial [Rickettsia sp. TH2014]|uniref:hypothetical protein n=1 Tax=Rickettsia sp. TH2014 TaxID=1967503 RepID=UPI001C468C58